MTTNEPTTVDPAITGERTGGWTLSHGLAALLVLYGLARLVLLVYAISSAARFLHWPLGQLDLGYLGVTRAVLGYALPAAVPIVLGMAMLRGRPWTRAAGPALCLAALIFDLYLVVFGQFGARAQGLNPFGTTVSYVQFAAAAILLSAAAIVLWTARTDGPVAATLRPSAYSRSVGLLLAFLGVVQIVLPDLTVATGGPGAARSWDAAYTLWRLAPYSELFAWRFRIAVDVLAYAGVGVAALVAGIGLVRRASWARPIAIVVCIFGITLNLQGIIRLGYGTSTGVLGASYALWMLAILVLLLAYRRTESRKPQAPSTAPAVAEQAVHSTIPDDEGWHAALVASLRATGVEPPRHSLVRRVLVITLLIVIGLVTTLFARYGMPVVLRGEPAHVQYAALGLWYAGGIFVISPILFAIRRTAMAMKAKSATDELASAGGRRPILYLRSFEMDEDTARPSVLELVGIVTAASSPEAKLAKQLSRAGPVVAIGRPGETLPPLGAARFYVTDELWKQKVADVAKASQLVVWTSGLSDGLRWEIGYLLRSLPAEKLVLWAHPHVVVKRAGRETEWARFRDKLGGLFPKPLPAALGPTEIFAFAADGTPVPVEPKLGFFRRFARRLFGALVPSLKAMLAMKRLA